MNGKIENCRFDYSDLRGIRIWATTMQDVSFRHANLRDSVLGGVKDGVWNRFIDVDFSEANLSRTIYEAAEFERCAFVDSNIVNVDFQSSNFKNCRFEGELKDVLFYRHGFKGEGYPPNEMMDVDFTGANLHDVDFRDLDLAGVRFPSDDEHLVIQNFAVALDRAAAALEKNEDEVAKRLIAFIRRYRRWAVPGQAQGIINLRDLAEIVGENGVRRFVDALRK
jgi:uncharacterized protein YjbI with pentapeptide repeats